ncbi:MAG: uroporphyrinogen decarboxylase family protein [Kiritimatiellia bacterium]|nr:uroporphyrinogen decarboxylase family protein [Kiritimatiellia bacterium]
MTSRERIEAALNHKQPDRTPLFEYVLQSPRADDLLGRRYAADSTYWDEILAEKGWKDAVRQGAVDRLELALLLGNDMLYVTPNPAPASIAPMPGPPAPEISADPVERVRLRNEQRAQASFPPDDTFLIYHYLKEEMKNRDVDLPILAPAYVHGVWDDVDLMQTLLLAPEVAHCHFALATQRALKLIEKYVALGIDQVGVGGDFSGTRPLISPAAYREFIVPEVRKISRRIHEANKYAVNASDGNLWPVIEDFLFGCEVDGYLEIDLHAGMDMKKLKDICRGKITLYGNLDCGNTLSFGSREDVRRHTRACLEAGMGGGGHILCASNAITASVPLDNYLTVINTYRDMFGLARFAIRV